LIWESILVAIGIAAAGYFIGNGLKNFNNPDTKNRFDLSNEVDEHELIKENEVHNFMGVSKEDATSLIEEHPDIPHIIINNKVYYPKSKLRKWLLSIIG
jgi:hypothetical protein